MPPIIEGPPEPDDTKRPLGGRLIWFAALWLASVFVVAVAAYALRALIT